MRGGREEGVVISLYVRFLPAAEKTMNIICKKVLNLLMMQ